MMLFLFSVGVPSDANRHGREEEIRQSVYSMGFAENEDYYR